MNLSFHLGRLLPLLVLVSILTAHTTKASHPLAAQLQGVGDEASADGGFKHSNEMDTLMGMECDEDCDDGDENCMERRVISEAHLDYIYTQHQKP